MSTFSNLRIAVDIGGTFTDTVLVDAENEVLATTKTSTTQNNPTTGAMEGVRHVLQKSGAKFGDVEGFIHGTTLATNALIERRGAKVASITTAGFRDILEIAYERRYSQYDINIDKPDLIVPRSRSFTVHERISVSGDVITPLDESAVDALAKELAHSGVDAVAICLLHAYANSAHEKRLRELLLQKQPDLIISISSEVSPEAREFERLCTTVANAYILPMMSSYLQEFEKSFAKEGMICPILMMTAGGGMTTIKTASEFPIRLIESGPAGGAILAAQIAAQLGADKVLSFDMGGTTAKLCLIDGFKPQTARKFEISRAARFIKGSGMPVRIPVLEMIEIGAGGGSIAGVDSLGRLQVGPRSAGSDPGPAAFDKGGMEATVTDADIALGYIDSETFAEGRITINQPATVSALKASVGDALKLNTSQSAMGISEIVDESMASAGRMHAVESGKDLGERVMIAFGGNGPLHATRVARRAGVTIILIPPAPGVGSAVGFLFAPVSFEMVRSRYTTLDKFDPVDLNRFFEAMIKEAETVVKAGAPQEELVRIRSAYMRYHGQGHEIEIPLPDRDLSKTDVALLRDAFETEYARQFSRAVPGMTIEILNWAVSISTPAKPVEPAAKTHKPKNAKTSLSRSIFCDVTGQTVDASVYHRQALEHGDILQGPALIVEPQTTTLVSADFSARVDGLGNLLMSRNQPAEEST